VASGGVAYNTNDQTSDIKEHVARVDERLLAHLQNHPNVGLQRQIDALVAQMNEMRRRQRELELRVRQPDAEH